LNGADATIAQLQQVAVNLGGVQQDDGIGEQPSGPQTDDVPNLSLSTFHPFEIYSSSIGTYATAGTWQLSSPSQGGYIIQNVTVTYAIFDKNGNSTSVLYDGEVMSPSPINYWEAWQVAPGSQLTVTAAAGNKWDETNGFPGGPTGSSGYISVTTSATFYQGLSQLPPGFAVGNAPMAGTLPSATTFNLRWLNVSNTVTRTFGATWP
jgi:hypothetical protein